MNNDDIFQTLPQHKAELMERIRQERAALEGAISGLSEPEMTRPGPEGWSIKDHLAHIVAWEQVLVIHYLQGRSFGEAAGMDEATAAATAHMTAEGGLNDYFYERDKNLSTSKVLDDFETSHQQVLAALEGLDYEALMKPYQPDDHDDSKLVINKVIGNTYEHYREHRLIIESLLSA